MTGSLRPPRLGSSIQLFLRQSLADWHHTGAVAPSSKALARAITQPFAARDRTRPVRIAEVGPGTGAFTKAVAKAMAEKDRFDIFDINPSFLSHVERLIERHKAFENVRDRIHLHEMDARELESDTGYDFMISGLPFNNFTPDVVRSIIDAYFASTRSGGTISFFEYIGARRAKKLLSKKKTRGALHGIDQLLKDYLANYQEKLSVVLVNIPPAIVHHLRKP